MASSLKVTVNSDESQAFMQQLFQLDTNKSREAALALSRYFKDVASGRMRASFDVQTGGAAPVRASATWTLASVVATDACTVGGVTFTFTSSPSAETDVEVDGADDTADAAALAAAVNAHSTISKQVSATSALGVVTIEAREAGVMGNLIAISDADSTITTSSAYLANGAGGADDDAVAYDGNL